MSVNARIMRRVNDIPFRKGTAGWLNKFVTIIWQNGFAGLEAYALTPEQLFRLKYIAKGLNVRDDRTSCFLEEGVYAFLKKYGFRVAMFESGGYMVDCSRERANG